MRVDDFDFHLPEDRIALAPARPRDSARLLHIAAQSFADHRVSDLPSLLRSGDLLVLNDTKVIPAQLTGVRPARAEGGGGDVSIDVTLHKRVDVDQWKGFVRPAKRLRAGDQLAFGEKLMATISSRQEAEALLVFNQQGKDLDRAIAKVGAPPLPPYIARKRTATEADEAAYQTVYAREEGSVAAPTAGLHFTEELFDQLAAAGVGIETITLHVGAGTFLPVTAEDTADHKMHSEWGEITEAQAARINETRAAGGRIVSVGTTSLRLLESAAQEDGQIQPFCEETDIFITPGYRFKAVDLLMTNFHLPRSTLVMLVSAFAGVKAIKDAYQAAIDRNYRFYSYGDACLLERAE